MSMPVTFYALTPKQLEKYERLVRKAQAQADKAPEQATTARADDDWSEVVPSGPDPEDILERAASKKDTFVSLDWESFGLSYLLGERKPAGRFELVFGPNDNPDNLCAVLPPAQVKAAAESLARQPAETLRARWNPKEMEKTGVYPETAWSEPDALEALIGAFELLEALFQRAARNGWAIIVDGRV
jgi:hypothetical protein